MTLIGIQDGILQAFGGTKFINLRFDSVQQNMPYLKHLFLNQKKDGWVDKISVVANKIGIAEQENPIEIRNVFFIHCDNRVEKLDVSSGDKWRNNFLLYQNLSSHIRGQAATFINKDGHPIGYLPSFDNEEIYRKRMKIIDSINNNPNYYYVNGNLQSILKFVDLLYNRDIIRENMVKKMIKK